MAQGAWYKRPANVKHAILNDDNDEDGNTVSRPTVERRQIEQYEDVSPNDNDE